MHFKVFLTVLRENSRSNQGLTFRLSEGNMDMFLGPTVLTITVALILELKCNLHTLAGLKSEWEEFRELLTHRTCNLHLDH